MTAGKKGLLCGVSAKSLFAIPQMALTDIQIRDAKAGSKAYKLADSNGLFLQVSVSGAKLWRMKFRHSGKEGLLSFGPYPLITLAEAREKRDKARRQIRDGLNPALEKRRAAIAAKAAAANTFALVAEEVVAKREREGLAPTTAAKLRWYASLLSRVGNRPVGEIEAFELLESLRKIEASGRHETAVNTLAFAGPAWRADIAEGDASCGHHRC